MKQKVITAILEKLNLELASALQAAKAAHEAATGEESKPENEYDTRSVEAAYLAQAHMKRSGEIERQIVFFQQHLSSKGPNSLKVSIGSLVELEQQKRKQLYLIASEGGGLSVEIDGKLIQVITPSAPLGEACIGAAAGETIEVENKGATRLFKLLRVE